MPFLPNPKRGSSDVSGLLSWPGSEPLLSREGALPILGTASGACTGYSASVSLPPSLGRGLPHPPAPSEFSRWELLADQRVDAERPGHWSLAPFLAGHSRQRLLSCQVSPIPQLRDLGAPTAPLASRAGVSIHSSPQTLPTPLHITPPLNSLSVPSVSHGGLG